MPLPRAIAKFNKVGLNKLTIRLAPWMPGFGIVTHRGRKSGASYRIPINVFQRRDGYLFCLTYGKNTDWVRNVLAAGDCGLLTRRVDHRLTNPRLEHHEKPVPELPFVVRTILSLVKVTDYLQLDIEVDHGAQDNDQRDNEAGENDEA